MKSIRLSLVLYFLVLLAVALGAVSILVYETTRETLLAKQTRVRELLKTQHDEQCQEVRDTFDKHLLYQANNLGSLAQYQFQWNRAAWQNLCVPALLVSAPVVPCGYVPVAALAAELAPPPPFPPLRNSLAERVRLALVTEIQFNEDGLHGEPDAGGNEYFQINSEWGNTWRSRSLGNRLFPVDAQVFAASIPFYSAKLDDFALSPGHTVRHLALKVPVARFRVVHGGRVMTAGPPAPSSERPTRPGRNDGPRGPDVASGGSRPDRPLTAGPRQPETFESASRSFFIQCAAETAGRDAALGELDAKFDGELADLETESAATLAGLRNRLLWISVSTFLATLVGGFGLVRLGLAPLSRLSDAVSQVSEKDFRLPINDAHLPRELTPIAQRLRQTLEMLQRAFAREKQAAADISHELRTPLAALLTTIDLALRKPRSPDEYRELLVECRGSGQQMNQLVERLLALARLDAGADLLRPMQVDAAEVAKQCADLVRPLAEAHDLRLQADCAGPAYIRTDPSKLREVLNNLLHNAIQYNRPQGSVELAVRRQNGHLCVEVRDTGIGIAPQACEHIFERFYRADPSRQADGLHAGLGLAIVKGYVDLMGGTVTVQSSEGKGSTFRVELPVRE